MKSPLSGNNAVLEGKICCSQIVEDYKKNFGYDVSYLFRERTQIEIYRCLDSGYKFYYPYNISGDSSFYAHLQKFDWYYMPWKWEHRKAFEFINSNAKVLEVGCGKGEFLERITVLKQAHCIGLELNEAVSTYDKDSRITILNESIEDYSKVHQNEFDLVCVFQVLEHIADVRIFLESLISCLKLGGLLIISVPNNDSYIKHSNNILNIPPHHMGLWNKKSLLSLQNYFPIKLKSVHYEPIQKYHATYFKVTLKHYLHLKFNIKLRIIDLLYPLFKIMSSKKFKAFTILVIFERDEIH